MRFTNYSLLLNLLIITLLSQCSSSAQTKNELLQAIQSSEASLKANEGTDEMNKEIANNLVAKSILFAEQFPDDPEVPSILFKAADVTRGIGNYEQAIDLWGEVVEIYPDYGKAPEALFHQGFIMDKDVGNTAEAIAYYEAFLSAYPQHPMAKDVALLKQFLEVDISPEDLIKEFEKKRTQ